MSRKRHRKGKKDRKPRSPLDWHHREGKFLHPPFQRVKGIHLVSWTNTRLPDQLWTALIVTRLERSFGIEVLRTVAKACQGEFKSGIVDLDLTHTGLASMPEELADRIIRLVCAAPGSHDALEPLLLFDDLPDRERWLHHLGSNVSLDAWNKLADTVARVLHHQSQESTDTRWARVLFRIATGQMHLQSQEQFVWLAEYPKEGDQSRVQPFIRASEMSEYPFHDYSNRDRWADSFWRQCLMRTSCGQFLKLALRIPSAATNRPHVLSVLTQLISAAQTTSTTSATDARHTSVFGLAAYALETLIELLGIGTAQGILGRLGLRAIFEAYVTQIYLAVKDDPALWESYRAYGQGQAKLAMLKVDKFVDVPSFVTPDLLEQLAGEDKMPEYLSINLGHWANADLRKLSEIAGVKEVYDRLYPWTSAFVHANWASVRAASFALCGNPLHRLHAVLQPSGNALDDVVEDACDLIDEMLSTVERMYSVQITRVTLSKST
jgi:hypothetical protein